ncbi:TlpA disulfide reductase family protein [Actinoplanes sp. Pm04-4]|uniref:TlpA disulfide reductase family protein n=1 Tax=Paractinoplanes pyxinae TaxID=2997416 RepID=A0ABT4B7R9_9ACTN|nr:TlpA disulfide reductase family protein [Actinoplanes pyxinae]MCY1142551.1 TlpA disulfide reductase family protein [Actinoplanes pyxinae]
MNQAVRCGQAAAAGKPARSRLTRLLVAPMVLVLAAALAACGDDEPAIASPFTGCGSLTEPPAAAATDLPDLQLPCFTGDDEVSLRSLRGPAVINIWASWCEPCRTELPVMQGLADKAEGRVTVLGVDSGDKRDKGADFATDKGVRMPTLFDEKGALLNNLGRINLPVTVFVDSSGKSYVHPLPLDARGLSEQLRKHTGVTVTP